MTLVLDTSILIDLERKNKMTIDFLKKVITLHKSQAKITFVNAFEFLVGAKRRLPKNLEKAELFLNEFIVLHTTNSTVRILSDLEHKYKSRGLEVKLADLMIASLVIESNATLLTKDKGFERIAELNKIIV